MTTTNTDLPTRLRELAATLEGDEWQHPVDAVEICRLAADEVEKVRTERHEARWAVRYLLENITQLQTKADLWGLRKKLTWLMEAD